MKHLIWFSLCLIPVWISCENVPDDLSLRQYDWELSKISSPQLNTVNDGENFLLNFRNDSTAIVFMPLNTCTLKFQIDTLNVIAWQTESCTELCCGSPLEEALIPALVTTNFFLMEQKSVTFAGNGNFVEWSRGRRKN